MSKERCKELTAIGDKLFGSRASLESLWQDIAENFHPERADFTTTHSLGNEFASHLMTGFPAVQLRELADQLAGMLRPRSRLWAKLTASNAQINDDSASQQWLEAASERQRKAMYAAKAQFLRATKTSDYDFVAFGQAVILPSLNRDRDGLLYRAFHLRDTAWYEGSDGAIESVHRKEKRCARDLVKYFPKTVSEEVRNIAEKEPYREYECRHIVVPADQYEYEGKSKNTDRFPFVSIWIDKDNDTILEEVPQTRLGYVIPRWRLGAFGQYATSPCTMLALPDGRLLQQMTLSLLEATEKAATPPMIATIDAVRTDMQTFAGGVTWVDKEYDEKLGEALRPLNQDMRGLQFAEKMLGDVREMLKGIFFLNKINLPEIGHDMTAFETRKRVEEYVRSALPLFEPMEVENNAAICNETFGILVENNGFGPAQEMPEALRGADVHFEFESPLQATAERVKADAFMQAVPLVESAMKLDPDAGLMMDVKQALSDALDGVEAPKNWKLDRKVVEQLIAKQQQMRQQQQALQQVSHVAGVAEQTGNAVQALTGKAA